MIILQYIMIVLFTAVLIIFGPFHYLIKFIINEITGRKKDREELIELLKKNKPDKDIDTSNCERYI